MRPPHSDWFRARRRRLLGAVCNLTRHQREQVRLVEGDLARFERWPGW